VLDKMGASVRLSIVSNFFCWFGAGENELEIDPGAPVGLVAAGLTNPEAPLLRPG
jgi:hypothetical protein